MYCGPDEGQQSLSISNKDADQKALIQNHNNNREITTIKNYIFLDIYCVALWQTNAALNRAS